MDENKPAGNGLDDIRDIRRIMERSSRFVSLSGLSGVAAGIFALAGTYVAYRMLDSYSGADNSRGIFSGDDFAMLKIRMLAAAIVTFILAFCSSYYLTWRKAKRNGLPVWDATSRRLAIHMIVPLVAGAVFILGMLRYDNWLFVAPASLVFYGLALVNASKYTLSDIRYLGYCEIILGLINMYFPGYGLWFWAMGFGVLHIIYGISMWMKYEQHADVPA